MKEILYYRKLKDEPLVQICDVPCMAHLKLDYFTGKFAAITEEHYLTAANKKTGMYSGFLYENRKVEFEFYDDSFADDKKYTKEEADNIEHPVFWFMPECCMKNGIPNRILNINGKVFHFVPFDKWGKSWDSTFELSVESTTEELKEKEKQSLPPWGYTRYYGMNDFKGLVSLEPATTDECGRFDLEEQLEAAKLGCDVIYECLK